MGTLCLDLKQTLRSLAKQRTFTAAVVLTLAFGIGANTAIVSLLNPLMLRPLAVQDADRLVRVFTGREGQRLYGRVAYPTYVDLRSGTRVDDRSRRVLVADALQLHRGSGESSQAERVWGLVVSGNFFSTLKVSPVVGRLMTVGDDRAPGAHPVAVTSHRLWRTRFNAAADVVGRRIQLNGLLTAISVWKWRRLDLVTGIRAGDPVVSTGAGRMFMRDALVVGQLAISLLLLVVAVFFVKSH